MNQKVNRPVAVVAFAVLVGVMYLLVRWSFRPVSANANPGLVDIPPRTAEDSKTVAPPKDAGPAPGVMKR